MKLRIFVLRRLLSAVPVFIGILTVTFLLQSLLPVQQQAAIAGCPNGGAWGQPAGPAQSLYASCKLPLPWTQPAPLRYGAYLANMLTLHWGYENPNSYMARNNLAVMACAAPCQVTTLIGNWLPYSVELLALGGLLALFLGIPLVSSSVLLSAHTKGRWARILSGSGYALPYYLLPSYLLLVAIALVGLQSNNSIGCSGGVWGTLTGSWSNCFYLFYPKTSLPPFLGISGVTHPTGIPTLDAILYAATHAAPAGAPSYYFWSVAADQVRRLLLPALALCFVFLASLSRFTRLPEPGVPSQDPRSYSRARGAPERGAFHATLRRNALTILLQSSGLVLSTSLVGLVLIEIVFRLDGLGTLFSLALLAPWDYGTLLGCIVAFAGLTLILNVALDVWRATIDPRRRTLS